MAKKKKNKNKNRPDQAAVNPKVIQPDKQPEEQIPGAEPEQVKAPEQIPGAEPERVKVPEEQIPAAQPEQENKSEPEKQPQPDPKDQPEPEQAVQPEEKAPAPRSMEKKGKKAKKKSSPTRRLLIVLLSLVLVVSMGVVAFQLCQYILGELIYDEAQGLVDMPNLSLIDPDKSSGSQSTDVSQSGGQSGDVSGSTSGDISGDVSGSTSGDISGDVSGSTSGDISGDVSQPEDPEPEQKPEPDPYQEALQKMDFTALQKVNKDVCGWIVIPKTQVSYPLLQGDDNQEYLYRTWKRSWSTLGSIFLDSTMKRDLNQFNTIVYGHRMQNTAMFGSLRYYSKQSYWKSHPTVYINNGNGTNAYDIYAAYQAPVDAPTFWINVTAPEHKQRFIDYGLEHSVINTGIVPTINDQILTLSTCTGNGHAARWIVQAVRR